MPETPAAFRRRIVQPIAAKPRSIVIHVPGSGTGGTGKHRRDWDPRSTCAYLWRWLAVTGVMFALSAASYALALRRARDRSRNSSGRKARSA